MDKRPGHQEVRATTPGEFNSPIAKGRTVIPATLREQAGIREGGDTLVGYVEDGRLVFETRTAVRRRVRVQAAATGAKGVVDRLLADRRADREREERDRSGREG